MWDPGSSALQVHMRGNYCDSPEIHNDKWLECVRQVGGTWDLVEKVVLSPNIAEAIQKMANQIVVMFPKHRQDFNRIQLIIKVAFYVCNLVFGEKEALEWADDFHFPVDLGFRDQQALEKFGGDLAAFVKEKHKLQASDRLSLQRIKTLGYEDEDVERLKSLVDGMEIVVGNSFKPNGNPPTLRAKYKRVAPAFNKMIMELYDSGSVLIIPTSTALLVPGVHFSSAHWTIKSGKKKGRNIGDCSNSSEGFSLNSKEVQELVRLKWGEISHPGIEDLVLMIIRQLDKVGIDELVLYKMDLKGAFTLLFIQPETVRLLAFELTDNLTMFYITGMFGWTGTPAAFDVVTRVLRKKLKEVLIGEADIYVDDILGVCARSELETEMSRARHVVLSLLGPNSLASDKEESSLLTGEIVWVGWGIDLRSSTVSFSTRNCLKCLYAFFSVDVNSPVKIINLQTLASLSSRYALVCRLMRPFCGALYGEMKGLRKRNISKLLSEESIRCIEMWRIFLVLMELDYESGYRRPFDSFRLRESSFLLEYDASLEGLGLVIFKLEDEEELLWKVVAVGLPYELEGNSSYQNTVEFIAVVLAFACLGTLGISNASIRLRGDNISSLKWSVKERFRGNLCIKAATLYIAIGSRLDMRVKDTIHLPGKSNIICDKLSRGASPSSLGFQAEEELICKDQEIMFFDVLSLCDPSKPWEECSQSSFWSRVDSIITKWGWSR